MDFPRLKANMGTMTDAVQLLVTYKAAIVSLWFALFFVAERLRPALAEPAAGRGRRLVSNFGLIAINLVLSPLIVVPSAAWAAGFAPSWRPDWWGGVPALLLDLLILDFVIYWWHRANHQFGFLWRFHQVHHLDRHLDTTSGLRFHFGEVLLSAGFRVAVIAALNMPISSVVAFETLLLLASLFHHSNIRLPAPAEAVVQRLIITPSIHRVHHHATDADTRSNMGTVLSLWDRLFGTKSRTPDSKDLKIGLEGEPVDPSLPGLIARPVHRPG